uniref:Receptor-like serine/threonine-protein kinase n=2 Tax=Noccaea caerulescens TaxID=107243 RepID=A0A1J3F3A5_NOCCA
MGKIGIVFFASLLFLLIIFPSYCYAAITKANPLSIGQTLGSPDGSYELGFFSPNNSRNQYVGIWFKNITPQVVVWVANRDKPVTKTTANLTISSNGSLVLLEGEQDLVWSIGETFSSNEVRGELLDNGNFVLRDEVSGRDLWQSFEHLGDTMLPQSSIMYDVPNNKKGVLSSWRSPADPSPGEFVAELTTQLPPQGFIMRGSRPYWRGGPSARERFTGTPEMDESHVSQFRISQDVAAGTGSLTYSLQRNSNLSYTTLTSDGSLKILWYNGSGWVNDFEAPRSSCDVYGACGAYGLCVTSNPPNCECMKGFIPKSDEEWNRRNWTGGCVRRTDLSCRLNSSAPTQDNNADVFDIVANVKPPDFYEYLSLINAEECQQRCLGNCSCMAFAYIDQIGCLVWNRELLDVMQFEAGGESLSIRVASSELAGSNRTKIIVATTVSISVFMVLVFASYWFWRYKAKQKDSTQPPMEASQDAWKKELQKQDVYFYEIQTILTITDNFSAENKLGQGGFGPVYKGKLQDGKEIAIKRLSSTSGQGLEEFMNEIILISKLQHRNLVRLLGCCIEGDEKLLIYEFMGNKSLNTFIFDSTKKLELDWPKRFDIIQGIACGLLYLHRDSCLRVVHRDLKVSNILLDEEMNPKISDFGLARMFQGTQNQDNTHRVVGTLGYMSPEYAWTGMFSEKSDIYSFGVLLLEIISGEKISRFSYNEECKSLLAYAWESWCETGGVDLLDKDVADSCDPSEVGRCVQIGLLCVQHQPVERPNTLELLSMLTTTSDLPLPKQPIFAVHNIDDRSNSNDLITVNDMTQSVVTGR